MTVKCESKEVWMVQGKLVGKKGGKKGEKDIEQMRKKNVRIIPTKSKIILKNTLKVDK